MRFVVLLAAALSITAASGETLIERGYKDMYNLQFDDAHSDFAKYQTMQPGDPLGPVSDAAACLFSEFDRLHILQSEFFLNDKNISGATSLHADPATRARFERDLSKARQLARARFESPSQRANAMFAETLRFGLNADYLALIDKRELPALGEVKKASEQAQKLLSGYPEYYDGYLAVGVENYVLSLKPAPVRRMLRIGGAGTDKQVGIRNLEVTAERGHYLLPYARLLLAIAALRDGDRRKASELLAWLAAEYPHNTLYKQELAKLH